MVKMMKKKGVNGIIALIYSDYREKIDLNNNCDGYPTIRLYKDGKVVSDFNRNWTQKDVLSKEANRFFRGKSKKSKTIKKTRKKRKRKKKKMTRKRKR